MVCLWVSGCVLCSPLEVPFRDFPGDPMSRAHVPNAGDVGLIPGQGARSHMLKLRPRVARKKKKEHKFQKCPPDPSSWINSSSALIPNITSFFEDLLSPNLEIISPAAVSSLH